MRVVSCLVVAAGLLSQALAVPANAAVTNGPTAVIPLGTIVGQTSTATLASATTAVVNQWLGVPFAAVPTGSLRFAPPASATKLSKPYQATALPPACLQQFQGAQNGMVVNEEIQYNNPHGPFPDESEDCLYANIYAPKDASPKNKKAVMIFIFGGEMQFGWSGNRWYNGSYFAGFNDIMVVSFNFRNTVFGFPGVSSEIPIEKHNVGLFDQRFALKWIHDNIAAFGGDPDQITIAGQSSGGWSVKQLMAFPPSPMTFRGAIIESQQTNVSRDTSGSEWKQLTEHFNCGSSQVSSPLECMRKVPGPDIRNWLDETGVLFNPVTDNVTCAVDIKSRVTNRQMADIPMIAGNTADEGRPFVYGVGITPGNASNSSAVQFLQEYFPDFPYFAQAAEVFINAFPTGIYEGLSRVVSDEAFICPTSAFLNTAQASGYNNIYRYHYTATFPNMENFPDAGAFHSAEIPQVFGTYDFPTVDGKFTTQQVALSKTMNTAWANFVKNPSKGPGFNWPKYNSFFLDVAKFETNGMSTTNRNDPDINCYMYASLINMNGF